MFRRFYPPSLIISRSPPSLFTSFVLSSSSSASSSLSSKDFKSMSNEQIINEIKEGNLPFADVEKALRPDMKRAVHIRREFVKQRVSPNLMSSAKSLSSGVDHDGTEASVWSELEKRGCVQGTNEIYDRKSKFLAHAAPISSKEEAKEIVALLREMKSIAMARHPTIWAYRLQSQNSKAIISDADDDGEKHASKTIMSVLNEMKISGWIVVVTRYFGGILLQEDRFDHIDTVTRDVLREAKAKK